uniref:CUB domain-containing protein n=1 Tax=Pundamilia nyererei TaxID=303518 RepID=A0A3B4F7A4_9CICH
VQSSLNSLLTTGLVRLSSWLQWGVIYSPGFPGSNYPDSSSCEWYLEGPTGHYLTLSYGNFSLQNTDGCSADYVEIRDLMGFWETWTTDPLDKKKGHLAYYQCSVQTPHFC